jgi:hypothetical protein
MDENTNKYLLYMLEKMYYIFPFRPYNKWYLNSDTEDINVPMTISDAEDKKSRRQLIHHWYSEGEKSRRQLHRQWIFDSNIRK